MNWGMYQRPDQWAYRLVFIIQIFVPLTYISGSFFIPESPRWLVGQGRYAEAKMELEVLRKTTSDELLGREIELIIAAEEENKAQFGISWSECFRYVASLPLASHAKELTKCTEEPTCDEP